MKQAIKNNWFYFQLIIVYSVILAIVYGYWAFSEKSPWWSVVIIVLVFIGAGLGIAFGYVSHQQKKLDAAKTEEEAPAEPIQ